MEITVYNMQGKESGKMDLPNIFDVKSSNTLLHEIVTGYLANQRAGTHSTKTRAEVKGGGIKPWRQKGTGRARAGSIRSPLWRKGGIIFGPEPRDYYQNIPRKKKKLSLLMALSEKAKGKNVIVVDSVSIDKPKTKNVVQILENLKIQGQKVLLIVDKLEEKLKIASRNIQGLLVEEYSTINTYQVLWVNKVVITSEAVKKLEEKGNK
ncbi:MAG: 50S ribosomal protein L4 [Endomicrobiales bacterium]|nr:50S ribosomal protein L4 [Endomicrobiales bacterium]